jgi:hypothetical protein
VQAGAAFEGVAAQLADAQTTVEMGTAKFLAQAAKGEPALAFFRLRQRGGFCEDGGKDEEGFGQAVAWDPRGIFRECRCGGSVR